MMMIVRDMMIGNDKLVAEGKREAGLGKNAIAAGFQGCARMDRFYDQR